jgi:hypothetical protein
MIMARIKIEDLPKNMKVSKEDLKKISGGIALSRQSLTLNIKPTHKYPEYNPFNADFPQYYAPS